MAFDILVRDVVWIDIEEAIMWYESKSAGLGERFFASFEKSLSKIVQNPEHYIYITKKVRRCSISRFPYSIHYTTKESTIIVLGVIHRKRSNAFLQKRFREK